MSRRLSQRTRSFVRRKLGFPSPLVHGRILDREFIVREGTVPSQLDYDYAWVLACALQAEVFFDVGANVGYDTLLALLSPTIKRVVLIEANPEALSVAAENLIHHQLVSKAYFVPAFAGAVDNNKVKFWTVGTGAAGSIHKSHAITAARANSYTWSFSLVTKLAPLYRLFLKGMPPTKSKKMTDQLVAIFFPLHWRVRHLRPAQMLLSRVSHMQAEMNSTHLIH